MPEKIFAAVLLAVCLLLLVRVFVGAARRARIDAAIARLSRRTGARIDAIVQAPGMRRRARREADDAIRRAGARGDWDGNVYRPKSFKKDRKLH